MSQQQEYQSVPVNEDDDFDDEPIIRSPPHSSNHSFNQSTSKSVTPKYFLIILASVAVVGYLLVWMMGGSVDDSIQRFHDIKQRAQSAFSQNHPPVDESILLDERIDRMLYQSFKQSVLLGDEEQAQEKAKLLVQAAKQRQPVTPSDQQSTKQSTPQSNEQPNEQTDPKSQDVASLLLSTPLDDTEDIDVAIKKRVNSKSLDLWEAAYPNVEYETVKSKNRWIKRDGWHLGGAHQFYAEGCIRLDGQCSTNNPEEARALCDRVGECIGFVCNKGRKDCQLRVEPAQHYQQDNIVSYYKDARALVSADLRGQYAKQAEKKLMKPGSTAAKGFNFTGVCGKNGYKCVISYGLYGSNPKYGEGAIENAKLLDSEFPGWVIRIYHDSTVPKDLLGRLADMGSELVKVDGGVESGSIAGMFWRFLVAEDETVDRYIVRDTDSRLNPREKAAVDEWLNSGFSIHTIRDHPNHDRPLNGGMWGGTKGSLLNIRSLIASSRRDGYGADLDFLNEKVWPLIKYDQIGHDSYSCHKYINSYPFPTKRPDDYQHVGQVFENNKPRMGDITGFLINNPAPMQCRKQPDWLYG